jgi:hypothetical protein
MDPNMVGSIVGSMNAFRKYECINKLNAFMKCSITQQMKAAISHKPPIALQGL